MNSIYSEGEILLRFIFSFNLFLVCLFSIEIVYHKTKLGYKHTP